MRFPLIGGQKDRKTQQQYDAFAKYENEMLNKLREWEFENNCTVNPVLIVGERDISSRIHFKKMDQQTKDHYNNLVQLNEQTQASSEEKK